MKLIRSACVISLVVISLTVTGCGGSGVGSVSTYPVKGTLKYKGKPITAATITFLHDSGKFSPSATTGNNGEYELTTFETGDGAPSGAYIVTVGIPEDGDDEGKSSLPVGLAQAASKYSDPGKSPLKFTVESGKPNQFDIEIE